MAAADPALRIGVDLGGTKTEIVVLEADGRERLRRRAPTPAGDYRATLQLIASLVADAEREAGRAASIGIGTPGAISPATGRMRNSNSTCLNGQPLRDDVERLLGRPVAMANDANCFILSEATDGAAAGAAVAFGVILGTGVGGGIVVHGRVLDGCNAIAGEWGHNPLPWPADDERPGPRCYCGKHGCIETWLSGPGLARDHEAHAGTRTTANAIVKSALRGDRDAHATLERYERRLARALASVINVLDPGVIVLGGGLSNIERLYESVPALWGDWVFSDAVRTRLVRASHGDSSGVRGAALLSAR
jgi:predicted NBD/HSP70 family sugar kinase